MSHVIEYPCGCVFLETCEGGSETLVLCDFSGCRVTL